MAGLYVKTELRPCYVTTYKTDDKCCPKKDVEVKALFHCWSQESNVVPPSIMVGGHSGGVVSGILGVVEFESGKVRKVDPSDIRFCPGEFKNYCFSKEATDE